MDVMMDASKVTFGTLVTCIDGRVQRPTILWMRYRFNLDYVDVISEPGPDKLLSDAWPTEVDPVRKKVGFSISAHASRLVAVCGHYDCAGNPATPDEHKEQIRRSVALMRSWDLGAEVVGLWLNEDWLIEMIEGPLERR